VVDTMNNILLAGQVSGALIAILSLVGMLVKYGIVKPIKAYIDTMTYAIQPHANGGKSLPDLINKVDDIKLLLDQHIKTHDTPK
jgi:xanthosine utilization system XapX-like protein